MVKVVTDSCSDIPGHIAQALGITVVPLGVSFGDEIYQDGVDISADEFYARLIKEPILPKTMAPSPGVFAETYNRLATETDEIISIHISRKLSATYDSALLGKEQLEPTCHIEVIDSRMASMGIGLLTITAARAALAGADLDQITALIHQAIPRTHYFGLVDSLQYLHKGGRLGKGQAFLGSILNVKPLLEVKDGEVHPLERVRSYPKALARLCELAKRFSNVEELAITHATTPDEAEALSTQLASLAPKGHMYKARLGSVIGTYLGPGALAIALIEGEKNVKTQLLNQQVDAHPTPVAPHPHPPETPS